MSSTTIAQTRHAVPEVDGLFRVNVRSIWQFLLKQPLSFWFINAYLFLEYVRPQSIWRSLAFLPWGQVAILGTLLALIFEGKMLRPRTIGAGLLFAFTGVVILSSVFAIRPSVSWAAWEAYYPWVLIFLLITNTVTTERRFFIFTLAFLLYSFKMSQHGFRTWASRGFAFAGWGVTGAPGWFQNSGEMGIQMCVFLPLCVEFILGLRKHWGRWTRVFFYSIPVTIVGSIVATSSRGALIGAGCVALWWVIRSKQRVRALIAVAALGLLTWTVVPEEQKARFSTAGSDNTSISRLDRWEAGIEMANERPILGIGYANWLTYYGPLSHNFFIEALAELGYTDLLVFLGLIGAAFWLNARTCRIVGRLPTETRFLHHMAHGLDGALIGFMGSGFFVTVLYYPYFWINLAMTVSLQIAAQHAHRRARAVGLPLGRTHRQPSPGIT